MRLVFFADGTWNKMDAFDKGTNVQKLCQATINDRKAGQITSYDAGVGSNWYDRLRGGAFGVGISQNIKDGYRFLVEEWSGPQDEIFLFGFSRGAYTVRSLAGLMNFVGLVRKGETKGETRSLIDLAYGFYRDADVIDPARAERSGKRVDPERKAAFDAFCARYVRDGQSRARIKLLGVWDTVGALGIPMNWLNELVNPYPHKFHNTTLGANVDHAVHAVSIDEKRKPFAPTLWDEKDPRVTQVYFAGVHSDVGGGYDDAKLSDITLAWMADQAVRLGLQIDPSRLPTRAKDDYCGRQHESFGAAWRLLRRHDRDLRDGIRFHGSVKKRLEHAEPAFKPHPYRPTMLTTPWTRFVFDDDPFYTDMPPKAPPPPAPDLMQDGPGL